MSIHARLEGGFEAAKASSISCWWPVILPNSLHNFLNMAKSAEHAARPFFASAYRIRRFVREHALADRPHTSLWLAKTYVIPAGMYGSQVWGTGSLQADREFSSPLSTLHLHSLKGTLGVSEAVYH